MAAFPLPKINPLHQPSKRQMLKAQYKTLRPDVRRDTFMRDGMRCRACQMMVELHSDSPWRLANIHERTGGHKRAEEAIDVSLRSTITYCKRCHESIEHHEGLIERVLDETLGYNGPVEYTGKLPSGARLKQPYLSSPTISPQEARKP